MTSFPKRAGLRSWFVAVIVLGFAISPLAPAWRSRRASSIRAPWRWSPTPAGNPFSCARRRASRRRSCRRSRKGRRPTSWKVPSTRRTARPGTGSPPAVSPATSSPAILIDSAQGAAPAEVRRRRRSSWRRRRLPTEGETAEALPAPAASLEQLPANPTATADLNLRAGPSYDDAVLLVIPAGAVLSPPASGPRASSA